MADQKPSVWKPGPQAVRGGRTTRRDGEGPASRGEPAEPRSVVKARLAQPLDFLVVSHHAEFLGVFPLILIRSPNIMYSRLVKRWCS